MGDLLNRAYEFATELHAIAAINGTLPAVSNASRALNTTIETTLRDITAEVVTFEMVNESLGELEAARVALSHSSATTVEDPLLELLGTPGSELRGSQGISTSARILGSFYGRYEELVRIANKVTGLVTNKILPIERAIEVLNGLAGHHFVFVTLRAALWCKQHLLDSYAQGGYDALEPIRDARRRVDRSLANHLRNLRLYHELGSLSDQSDIAETTLHLYRSMIEGQLRPTCWWILRTLQSRDSRMPELTQLRDMLNAQESTVLLHAATLIHPAVRNAAAHEDYAWDDKEGVILAGEERIDTDTLAGLIECSSAVVAGAEIGVICAREESSELLEDLRRGDPPAGYNALNFPRAIDYFGTNGLAVTNSKLRGSELTITVESLHEGQVNPATQAMLWASTWLSDIENFTVNIHNKENFGFSLTRSDLQYTWTLWFNGRKHYSSMPVSVFLPTNYRARLAHETPKEAASAVAWMACNEAFTCIENFEHSPLKLREAEKVLKLDLSLIHYALRVTIAATQDEDAGAVQVLEAARKAVEKTLKMLAIPSRNRFARWTHIAEGDLLTARDKWTHPVVMPGLGFKPIT